MLWDVEWLVKTDGGRRNVPAFDFLLGQPPAVRIQLLAIVDAVRSTGPDQWRDTSSHDSMHGACEHLHEARNAVADDFARKALTTEEETG